MSGSYDSGMINPPVLVCVQLVLLFFSVLAICLITVCRGVNRGHVRRGGSLNSDNELKALSAEEKRLDEMIQICTQQVHKIFDDRLGQKYPFDQ